MSTPPGHDDEAAMLIPSGGVNPLSFSASPSPPSSSSSTRQQKPLLPYNTRLPPDYDAAQRRAPRVSLCACTNELVALLLAFTLNLGLAGVQTFYALQMKSSVLFASAMIMFVDVSAYAINIWAEFYARRQEQENSRLGGGDGDTLTRRAKLGASWFSIASLVVVTAVVLNDAVKEYATDKQPRIDQALFIAFGWLGLGLDFLSILFFFVSFRSSDGERCRFKCEQFDGGDVNMVSAFAHVGIDLARGVTIVAVSFLLGDGNRIEHKARIDAIATFAVVGFSFLGILILAWITVRECIKKPRKKCDEMKI